MPWDWIGIVTIRSDTRRSTSTNGTIRRQPGLADPDHPAEPEQHALLVLLDDAHRQRQADHHQDDEQTMTMTRMSMSCPHRGDHCGIRRRAILLPRARPARRPGPELADNPAASACASRPLPVNCARIRARGRQQRPANVGNGRVPLADSSPQLAVGSLGRQAAVDQDADRLVDGAQVGQRCAQRLGVRRPGPGEMLVQVDRRVARPQ